MSSAPNLDPFRRATNLDHLPHSALVVQVDQGRIVPIDPGRAAKKGNSVRFSGMSFQFTTTNRNFWGSRWRADTTGNSSSGGSVGNRAVATSVIIIILLLLLM